MDIEIARKVKTSYGFFLSDVFYDFTTLQVLAEGDILHFEENPDEAIPLIDAGLAEQFDNHGEVVGTVAAKELLEELLPKLEELIEQDER